MGEAALIPLEQEARRDNEIASDWLLHYEDHKRRYYDEIEGAVYGSGLSLADPRTAPTNAISDPTARVGMALMGSTTGQWLALIAEVEQRLPWKMQVFLRLRREHRHARGNQGWVAAVQWGYAAAVADKFDKELEDVWIESRNTFNVWWQRIVDYTVRLAAKRGLL